jgi:outer membrane protein assembly factor BamB
MVIFGGGDGWCYGFDPEPMEGTLREIWRCDCNPLSRRMKNGKPLKHDSPEGPSEIIATPVLYKDRVYLAIGQEPENGTGSGCFTCIDATKTGDITGTGKVWFNDQIGRSVSTASVSDGLAYVADFGGFVHCLDADTGRSVWDHDTEAAVWGSTLVANGKVYVGNENGTLIVLSAGKEKKVLGTVDFKEPLYSSPIVANAVLYVATPTRLYAIRGDHP